LKLTLKSRDKTSRINNIAGLKYTRKTKSGRVKGNTAQLVSHFVKEAEERGHSIEVISLIKSEVKRCLGCNACRYGKPCVQKDAFNDFVPKIKDADCIVFKIAFCKMCFTLCGRFGSNLGGVAGCID